MLKIGEFSAMSRVSIRMLRHYDEIGLLKPAQTDVTTGYRYYSENQLHDIGRIVSLRAMGFSLADTASALEVYSDAAQLDKWLEKRRNELLEQSRETARQLELLDAARERLRKEEKMSYDIIIKTIPERYAATVRMTIPRYEDEGMIWGVLMEETAGMNLVPADPCLAAAEFPDEEYREENVDVIAWKTVKGEYPDTRHVKFRTLPAVKVASCTIKGSYDRINECYAAIIEWINAGGCESAGPMFNIYHVSPYETTNPDEFVTEVCFPIK